MVVDYRVLVADALTGAVLDELPFTFDSPFSFKMGDIGTLSGHLPADHPTATHANIENGVRELIVTRNGSAVWGGPLAWSVDSASRMVQLEVQEPSAYFDTLVIESNLAYNEDKFAWVRDVWTYLTTKTSTAGDGTASAGLTINAGSRGTVSAGTSGFTLNSAIRAIDLVTFRDVLNKLAENPDQGIEWRIDYTGTGTGFGWVLTLGAPLGTTQTTQLTDWNLSGGYGRSGDPLRSATRAHVRGNGLYVTKQNTGSITDGWPLIEQVYDRGDISDATLLADAAREFRRAGQPPVKRRTATYVPGPMLPFGWCALGDTVPFDVHDPAPMLQITAQHHRVVQIDVMPPTGDNPELVTLTFDVALDSLGV